MFSQSSVTLSLIFQEVIPTSNSNTVVSLTRLFEMLLTGPLNEDPGNKNIRAWIMVIINLKGTTYNSVKVVNMNYFGLCRQLLPLPWCGLSVVAVILTAAVDLISF